MPGPRIDFSRFFSYAELRRHLQALARWQPKLAALHKIGKSPGGRDVLLLEVNNPKTGPSESKPAYLVQGNVHASEVSGCTSALYLAHYLLTHAEDDEAVATLLERIAFYIVPRVSVEGADVALVEGRGVRSRDTLEKRKNCIWPEDLNGDGRILRMRIPDPNGDQIALDDDPRLLLSRLPGDEGGTRYRVATEGLIHDWDGGPWSGPASTGFDFNRNWGFNWKPPHLQGGAGRHAFSEPEVRAVGDWVFDHPNIFGMLGFHTGPNSVLRPPSTGGDTSIDRGDIATFRELGKLGSDMTGFPIKAIHEYHSVFGQPYELWGHFPDWGYKALGMLTFEIELGILLNSVGFTTDEIFKFMARDRRDAERKQMAWHDAHPEEGAFVEWEPYDHPQLGPVEIGGWTPVGRGNVAPEDRVEVWDRCRQFIFDLAGRAPRLEIRDVTVDKLPGRIFKVGCRVANEGHLSTSVTKYGAGVKDVEGVIVEVERSGKVEFVAGRNYTNIGHLGAPGYRELEWVVRAPAKGRPALTIVARAARAGRAEVKAKLGK